MALLYLIVEKEFTDFAWCKRSMRSLYDETRKKRLSMKEIQSVDQIPESDKRAGVLLLGASENWFNYHAARANDLGHMPISLCSHVIPPADDTFSTVTMNLRNSICLAIDYLHSLGKCNIALYGVNPHSTSDPERANIFTHVTGRDAHIYKLTSSYEELFARFFGQIHEYDGIICANDYAAVSLVKHLKNRNVPAEEFPYIIGYGNMQLTEITSPTITSISDDYEHFGRAAVTIYNLLSKEPSLATINIQLHSHLHIRETTGNQPYEPERGERILLPDMEPNLFYFDDEVSGMSRMEAMLNQCDETDRQLIRGILNNLSYAEMAQESFISETAAKYRVKKMESFCGVSSRHDLLQYLKRYF